ncbi:hypothetical protein BAUCODRAFT_34224 [Baudoinia panamericana UAMH 10762]|uniref:NAD(P)-binding protein n=1 Tax=Baudoinia panamericana (strain UAMH 10762) TaxID=717646 RepID=M2LQX0_BAUPA|nr:uncharacterized protein BAUCODRAFT_34224 [Baudoinia panamericana UAMH 10762]EMC96827.1 hypothetical protein BAUCODRAFT_34224 [Baudoinia panamericana UAMH 10762]
MSIYWDAIRQCFFIPAPTFTENDLPSQAGRVFIVTGGYTGVGKELSSMLYQKNGTVYLAGRSKDKADAAIADIQKAHPSSDGRVEFLKLDLADLTTIKPSVDDFLRREQRLDVLTNNAGVMTPPLGSLTAQSHELQMGTNCLGPYLFTTLLTPILQKTAATSPPGSVRVTWAASLATMGAPTGGVTFEANSGGVKIFHDRFTDYAQSKAANVFLSREYQSRIGNASNIASNAWNPGNLLSELQRHQRGLEAWFTAKLCYPPRLGGYTELFAGWSEEAGARENWGRYVGPWGRFVGLRSDIEGNGERAGRFWEWCERETKAYR